MGGWCHRGLRRSAETLLEDAKEGLLDQLKRHNGYRLVLCGHSLGAGKCKGVFRKKKSRSCAVAGLQVTNCLVPGSWVSGSNPNGRGHRERVAKERLGCVYSITLGFSPT